MGGVPAAMGRSVMCGLIGGQVLPTSIDLERAKIHIIGGRLVIRGGFAPGDESRYSNALFNFLSTGHVEFEIDLLRVGGVPKPFLDLTVSFGQFAGQMGRSVVVTARSSIARDLRIAGFEDVGSIRVIDG